MRTSPLLFLLSFICLSAKAEVRTGLDPEDWASIRTIYETAKYQLYPEYGGTYTARNPKLGWTITFDQTGFTASNGHWTWGLELQTTDSPEVVRKSIECNAPLKHSPVQKSGANHALRASYCVQRSEEVKEWFINDRRGLEQGWTLTGPAKIRLRVRGDFKPIITEKCIHFGEVISYSGLKAWDVTGKEVPVWFEYSLGGFQVCYDDQGATYPLTIDPIAQNAYLKASNGGAGDRFGASISVDGDRVAIGAPREDSNAIGIDGIQQNNSAVDSGAVYVFVRSGDSWIQEAYLKASNTGAGDSFGTSVAIFGDTLVVGAEGEDSNALGINGNQSNNSASNSGAAYVFVRIGNSWSQQAYLKASNSETGDLFGASVALSGDTLVVGAWGEANGLNEINGNQSGNSAPNAGAAYVFVRSDHIWTQQAYLKASNASAEAYFGFSVAVDEDTIVVGALAEASGATGVNGNQADASAGDSGAAYVFVRNGNHWSQQAYLKASNTDSGDFFGNSVAISGDTIVVGAYLESSNAVDVNGNQNNNSANGSGAAYLFVRSGTSWNQQAYLKASNTATTAGEESQTQRFGNSVAISGQTVVVGAYGEDSSSTGINGDQNNNGAPDSGAAYLFGRIGNTWKQDAYIKGSNTDMNDFFGVALGISDGTLVVGAFGESSSAAGVNGDQSDNSIGSAGAAYIFNFDGGESPPPNLKSLSKTEHSISSSGLAFGLPGLGVLSPNGNALFESKLVGSSSTRGRNRAIFSTRSGSSDIVLQSGSVVAGQLGLPVNASVTSLAQPVHNTIASSGLFQATVRGSGLNSASNRLLFMHDGFSAIPIMRTGFPVPELGHASPSSFREVLQREGTGDQIALGYNLRRGRAGVVISNDSGLLLLKHNGDVTQSEARAGEIAFGGNGTFGRIGRAAIIGVHRVAFLAKFIPDGSRPVDALFYYGDTNGREIPFQGSVAGGTSKGELYGSFTGVGRFSSFSLLRANLTKSQSSTNQGVWDDSGNLILRKGQQMEEGVFIARIIRVWGTDNGQLLAHVILSGDRVNGKSNQALVLRHSAFPHAFQMLLRTGQAAPGVSNPSITVGRLLAIDVDPMNGHYVILGSLAGATSKGNQALWTGQSILGNDTEQRLQRQPLLRLRKGEAYFTDLTFGDTINSINLRPVIDPSGVGGRGQGQVINSQGQIILTLTGDRRVQEIVRLTP